MRKIDTSSISSTAGMPVKSGVLQHLQLAYQEALSAILYNTIGQRSDNTNYFILYGCQNSGSGLNYNISAGAVLYNGEVFLVDAVVFTAATGQVAVGTFATTFNTGVNADPILFTDNVSRNVLQVRKLVFAAATSGSGAVDFANLLQTGNGVSNQIIALPATLTVNFRQNQNIFCSSAPSSCTISFDLNFAVPDTVVTIKWTFGAGLTLTINGGAGQTVIRMGGNLASAASANNELVIMYVGKNEAGNDEMRYILRQF